MIYRGRLVLVVAAAISMVAVFVAPGHASAMSEKTRNILNHVGQVSAAPTICPDAEVEDEKVALLLMMAGIDLKRDEHRRIIETKMRETIAALRGKDADMACAAIFLLYGPTGQNVPGLVRRK